MSSIYPINQLAHSSMNSKGDKPSKNQKIAIEQEKVQNLWWSSIVNPELVNLKNPCIGLSEDVARKILPQFLCNSDMISLARTNKTWEKILTQTLLDNWKDTCVARLFNGNEKPSIANLYNRFHEIVEKGTCALKKAEITVKASTITFKDFPMWVEDYNFLLFFQELEGQKYPFDPEKTIHQNAQMMRKRVNLDMVACVGTPIDLIVLPNEIGFLSKLVRIRMRRAQITYLPDSIGNLAGLKVLSLQNNQLKTLPETLGKLTQLEDLYLERNQLTSLPDSIGNLAGLKELSLQNNKLKTLPETIGNLAGLKVLFLQNNQLTSLPHFFGGSINLELLDLSHNKLSSLPRIENLNQLQSLDLNDNQLSSLPDSIKNLTELKRLYLDDNQLSSLPDSIGELNKLTTLGISHNQLSFISDSIKKLPFLTQLDLRDNKL